MNPFRILGSVVLAVGVALLIIGMNSSHSMADQVSNTFTGRFTDHTTWYIIGGIAVGFLGLAMTFLGPRGKNT